MTTPNLRRRRVGDPPNVMPVTEIRERLDRLVEHQFIAGWHYQDRRWYVNCSYLCGPYTKAQVSAWIEGANAMGAAS